MRVRIVECALIGQKRAAAFKPLTVATCADPVEGRAAPLASEHPDCIAPTDIDQVIPCDAVDAVIVATTPDALAKTTLAAIDAGRLLLAEKPPARSAAELQPMVAAAEARRAVVTAGHNHRLHPALKWARILSDSGTVSDLVFIRGRCRVSGRGELLDQGSHIIDLERWFGRRLHRSDR